MAYPMGEAKLEPLRVDFDRRLKLEFHGSDISSDAGLLPYRELDDALGLTELGGEVLSETRRGRNTRHLLVGHCHIKSDLLPNRAYALMVAMCIFNRLASRRTAKFGLYMN